MRNIASTSQEERIAEYEIVDSDRYDLTLWWLIMTAVIIWSGAWWLGQNEKNNSPQSQGETTTQVP